MHLQASPTCTDLCSVWTDVGLRKYLHSEVRLNHTATHRSRANPADRAPGVLDHEDDAHRIGGFCSVAFKGTAQDTEAPVLV